MVAKTNYLELKILNHVLRGEVYTPPTAWYVVLFTTDPGEAGDVVNEITTAARVAAAFTQATGTDPFCANVAEVLFDFTAGPVQPTHFGVADAAASGAGNVLYRAPLTDSSRIYQTGDQGRFAAGALVITED